MGDVKSLGSQPKPPSTGGVSRRGFMSYLGWGAVGAFILQVGASLFEFSIPRGSAVTSKAFKIGKPSDYKDGITYVEGKRVFVVRNGSTFRALSAVCTHLGCTVNWVPDHDRIECPCHGSNFDKDSGTVIAGPAPRPLDWYEIRLEGGELTVDPDVVVKVDKALKV